MIHAKTSYFPAWNKRFYFLYFIDSSDSFHPFRRNFDRSFIFTTDNIPLLFQVQLGSCCHQAESAYPTIKVTQVFPSSPCLGILFSPTGIITPLNRHGMIVFVPMFGDSFFTCLPQNKHYEVREEGFRPHVWGFFFHSRPGVPHGMSSLWPFCGGDFQLIRILIIFTL